MQLIFHDNIGYHCNKFHRKENIEFLISFDLCGQRWLSHLKNLNTVYILPCLHVVTYSDLIMSLLLSFSELFFESKRLEKNSINHIELIVPDHDANEDYDYIKKLHLKKKKRIRVIVL